VIVRFFDLGLDAPLGSGGVGTCIGRAEKMDLTRTPEGELRDYLLRAQPPPGTYRIVVNYEDGAEAAVTMRWDGHTARFSSGRTRASDAVRAEYAAEKARLEAAFRNSVVVVAHVELVSAATGLRRAVLELHGPERGTNRILCASCQADWEDYAADFPCPTYILARDWEDS
jgi:hypothetical protein